MIDRERAILTIKAYGEEIGRSLGKGKGPEEIRYADRQRLFEEAFAHACMHTGVSEDEMIDAIEADTSLRELEQAVSREALVGSADPGPYDFISRESASGSEENTHLDTEAARVAFKRAS